MNQSERSLGELFSELSQKTSLLIRQEVELAKTEMSQKMTAAARDAALIGAGGALAYAALLTGVFTIVLLMIRFGVAPWLAAGITTLVVAVIAFAIIRSGMQALRKKQMAPAETIESVKETAQWLKNEAR
jgi:cation transport ATPase